MTTASRPRTAVTLRALAARTLLVGSLLFAVAALVIPTAALADDSGSDDSNLTVTITDGSSPAPTPTSTSSTASGGSTGAGGSSGGSPSTSGGSSAGGSSSGAGGTTPASGGDLAAQPGSTSIPGIVTIGGLNSSPRLSTDPLGGSVRLWFTVRNDSQSDIDATAAFSIETWPFGWDIDASDDVMIGSLKPGESRVVSTQLHGPGQWTFIDAHVTFTPPSTIDGTEVAPMTRDAFVFVFPWLIAALAAFTLATILAVRLARRTSALSPPLAEAI